MFTMKKRLPKLIGLLLFCIVAGFAKGQKENAFLNEPMIIENPSSVEKYTSEKRQFTGIPSIAISPKGRMWAVWYAGTTPGEDANNYVVVATSGDKGNTWKEVLVIDPDDKGPVRAFDPEIWMAPDGKLWVFWAQATARAEGTWSMIKQGTLAGVWTLKIKDPELAIPEYDAPSRLTDGVMMCKPIVLTTGEWVLPASMWKIGKENARMVVSKDKGKTWKVRGGATVPEDIRSFDEHSIVERKDGSLWMLVRTNYGIGESVSTDRGFTWSPVVPSKIMHPSARFFIRRLKSGNILLVKHGPIGMQTGRSHLMAFISKDDGASWSDALLLDERPGVSYPDGQQVSDGNIYVIYDYNRTKDQDILFTYFSEQEVLEGTAQQIMDVFNRRKIVSSGGED